jgi:hypothetical protein
MGPEPHPQPTGLPQQARVFLVKRATQAMTGLRDVVFERLLHLLDEAGSSRDKQLRRDGWIKYQTCRGQWQAGVEQAWQAALEPSAIKKAELAQATSLELVGTEVMEDSILASRMALHLMEEAAAPVNEVRKRLRGLQGGQELAKTDLANPEALLLPIVAQWRACGLSDALWNAVAPVAQQHLTSHLALAYADCNQWLQGQAVGLPEPAPLSLSGLGQRAVVPNAERRADASPPAAPAPAPRRRAADRMLDGMTNVMAGSVAPPVATHGYRYAPEAQQLLAQVGQFLAAPAAQPAMVSMPQAVHQSLLQAAGYAMSGAASAMAPGWVSAPGSLVPASGPQSAQAMVAVPASPGLMAALAQVPVLTDAVYQQPLPAIQTGAPAVLERVGQVLREQSSALKVHAGTDQEKAIIEMVALMFQAILQEDRIPAGVRVWFARLQMPVVRVAVAEPDFFTKLDHPARQLIDRMGACVLGFDASGVGSQALESEIKRIVQVIEQYPDTGERVFRKVYEEFQVFLETHLTNTLGAQKVVGVAEQLEQKETLAVQFTIELRQQLEHMPVREVIREFLFKVWTDVLAVAAIRFGAKNDETLLLKKAASQLIWAASAKPSRAERARVIADLPVLLQSLREGMTLLGLAQAVKEGHIKTISDTLADAFMSKTEAIDDGQIQALAERLAHLEDYVEDELDELPLDAQAIEELLEVDTSALTVVLEGGGRATPIMLEWARELELGSWFALTLEAQSMQVQYVWRSPGKHLHLFATQQGQSYLLQKARLAGYLQAGLLEPQEDEPLTLRATREAFQKIQANPSQLTA